MLGISIDGDGHRNDRIRKRAEQVYGGRTTINKATREIKILAQKYGVGDLLSLEPTRSGMRVNVNSKIETRLVGDKYFKFLQQLVDALNDCGYDIAVADNFFEIHPV